MNASELQSVRMGEHWLCKLADELGKDAGEEISDLGAEDWTAGEIALAIMEGAQPHGITQESKIHVRMWPWEKKVILRAAYPNKLEDFVRTALIEKAMTTEIVPNPNRRRPRE